MVFLEPKLSVFPELVKNTQQELAYTSLHTFTATVKIWYDPDPQFTVIKEDQFFVEAFIAIHDEKMEQQLHLTILMAPSSLRWTMMFIAYRTRELQAGPAHNLEQK
jgi:RNA polymerase Rpb1, domain 7